MKKPYKVLSIGAGSCVDYYGLVFALLEYLNVKKLSKESIFYTGIDREDWLYVKTLKNENFEFIQNDLTRMHSFDSEDYNLVIFPKSIGDFNNYQFKKLEILFRNSIFSRNKICLINSYTGNNKEKERFNKIIDQMEHVHNYKCIDDKEDYSCYWDDEITIADTQKIIYPKEVLRKLEAYKRMPMLRAKYANTQIVRLEKK